jgi:hypothetical protein
MGMVIGGLFVHAVDRKCVVNTFLDCLSGTYIIYTAFTANQNLHSYNVINKPCIIRSIV